MYDHLINNRPDHLIGISATPYTDDEVQNRKIDDLFQQIYISECSYERAIKEQYINPCKFNIYGYEKCNQMIDKITDIIERKIRIRNDLKIWKRKKFIIWIPENNEKKNEYIKYFEVKKKWKVFTDINDREFKQYNTTDIPWCLVLCQRGREGYDRKDIEFGVSIGNSANHLYIQEQGRSQRIDYDGKLSELLIFTDKDKIDDVIEGISKYMCGDYIGEIGNIEDIDIEEVESEIKKQKKLQLIKEIRRMQNELNEFEESEREDRIIKHDKDSKNLRDKYYKQKNEKGNFIKFKEFVQILKQDNIYPGGYNIFKKEFTGKLPELNEIYIIYPEFKWADLHKENYYPFGDLLEKMKNIKKDNEEEYDDICEKEDDDLIQNWFCSKDKMIPPLERCGCLWNYYKCDKFNLCYFT
jgi:hypothetical protein